MSGWELKTQLHESGEGSVGVTSERVGRRVLGSRRGRGYIYTRPLLRVVFCEFLFSDSLFLFFTLAFYGVVYGVLARATARVGFGLREARTSAC